MAFTNKAWDGSASRWDDADKYVACCLIDLSKPDQPKTKDDGKLPVQEPTGEYNVNAMSAAAAALAGARGGVQAPPAAKKAAARKLLSLYRDANLDAPASLKHVAI